MCGISHKIESVVCAYEDEIIARAIKDIDFILDNFQFFEHIKRV
jgi:hypothetical protein